MMEIININVPKILKIMAFRGFITVLHLIGYDFEIFRQKVIEYDVNH